MAWYIRSLDSVQRPFREIWETDELVVSFDGACYMSQGEKHRDSNWTHTDQAPGKKGLHCVQGFVVLTTNSESTLRVYLGSHLLHEGVLINSDKKKDWVRIDDEWLRDHEGLKRVLTVPAGSLVLWDSRCFHQNQYGKISEERLVQYVCYLPKNAIVKLISECHYEPRPPVMYQNVRLRDVRRKLNQMKKLTPREYLRRFLNQFSYVAKEYSKMSPGEKAGYRDRLEAEAGSRPCLENLLESMVKVLVKPEFVWLGKAKNFENNPLLPNNERYVGYGLPKPMRGLVNTAIQTWRNSGNRPKNWAHMNLNARKNVFWGMIKGLPIARVLNGNIVYSTPAQYNRNGNIFKSSNLSNMLNYVEPIYIEPPKGPSPPPAPLKRKRSP